MKTSIDKQGAKFDDYGKTLVHVPSHITKFIIPDSVTSIGNGAFYECLK